MINYLMFYPSKEILLKEESQWNISPLDIPCIVPVTICCPPVVVALRQRGSENQGDN